VSDHYELVDESIEPSLHVDRWEGAWVRISIVVLVIFIGAIIVAALAFNVQLPGRVGRVDPNALDAPGSPFANPGLRELAPGKYEAYMVAQAWAFTPNPLVIPQGAEVTFYITSRDIQHGFKVAETNINMMVLPGQVSSLTAVFDEPGDYNIICHEYCGLAHHTMFGVITVEPTAELPAEPATEPTTSS
jgi:cytochrome c oxidase subunit 2